MDIQVALLEWINTFTLAEEVKSLSEIVDGHILWDILRDVDPTYFTSSLPEGRGNTTKWIPRYENLKFLHKSLVSYIAEECDQALFAPHAGDGLLVIAQNAPSSTSELVVLFQLVLQATILSPRQQEYILKMTSLTPASQKALKELIEDQEVTEESNWPHDGPSETGSETVVHDPELAFEERVGKIMAENQRMLQEREDLRNGMRSLDERLIRLQDNNTVLQQKLTEAEDCLQRNGSAHKDENKSVKILESKIQQQENDFADQENRMAKQARKTEALQKKIDNLEASLNSSARKAQNARDELDEITKERDALTKKANMVDKFKQQLQASNGLRKENENLLGQLDEYRSELGALQQARRDNVGLETELDEYKKLLPRIEEDNAEFSRIKRQLGLDNESLRKRHKQDQATILQLNQRVRSSSVSSIGSHDDDTLEGEFSGLADNQTKANERTSNMEKQNRQLESTVADQVSKIRSLQRLLDEANSRPKVQNDVRRSSFSSESPNATKRFGVPTMDAIAQPANSLISIEANQKLRVQLDAEETKRKKVEDSLQKTIQELNLAKKDLAYVSMDKLEMVAHIKEDNSGEVKDLRNERTLLQDINDRLESENREQKDILSRSNVQNTSLLEVSQEIKDLTAAIKEGKPHGDPSNAVDVFGQMIMNGRKEIVETQKEVEQQRTTIADLEKRLNDAGIDTETRRKEMEEKKVPSIPPDILTELAALRAENTNLKREQRLMASAFHDQASRLQLTNVTLQRRSEQPASWLGKQRRVVEGNLGVGMGMGRR